MMVGGIEVYAKYYNLEKYVVDDEQASTKNANKNREKLKIIKIIKDMKA